MPSCVQILRLSGLSLTFPDLKERTAFPPHSKGRGFQPEVLMKLNIDNLTILKGGNFAVLGSLISRIYLLAFLIAISCIGCEREYDLVISDMRIELNRIVCFRS